MVRESLHALGRIDIRVSNAARSLRSLFLHLPPEQFENVLTGTLSSGFYIISQCVSRHMVERGGGGNCFSSPACRQRSHMCTVRCVTPPRQD